MNNKQHLVAGVTTGGAIVAGHMFSTGAPFLDSTHMPILVGAAIGSLLPNLDNLFLNIIYRLGGDKYRYNERGIFHDLVFWVIFLTIMIGGHKTGIWRSLFANVDFGFFAKHLTYDEFIFELGIGGMNFIINAAILGILVHILLDGLTVEGVPIAFPFNRKFKLHFLPKDKMGMMHNDNGELVVDDYGHVIMEVEKRWRLEYDEYWSGTLVYSGIVVGILIINVLILRSLLPLGYNILGLWL
ncbi:MAG: metal-dependent hydrolase [Lachnospiraceae bacterium]|nr:metal-dependent hydrolase [Lachnospiraceae bacterium]